MAEFQTKQGKPLEVCISHKTSTHFEWFKLGNAN